MIRRLLLSYCLVLLCAQSVCAAPDDADVMTLIDGGSSRWTIVIPDEPAAQEREAADLMVTMLQRMSGVLMPIAREADAPGIRRILLGETDAGVTFAERLGIDRAALGEDGFAIRAHEGDLLVMPGHPDGGPTEPMGCVYAVSHLLETRLGVRFWAPGAMHIPPRATITLPADLSITEIPAFWHRQVNYGPAMKADYLRWHKLDRVQEEVGRLWAPRWVHSFFHHVDPDLYFEEHP
jgi:hypothetical protein